MEIKKGESWRKGYQAGCAETTKAFGGCTKCYGKGYGTSNEDQIVLADFESDKDYHHKAVQMVFCLCGRGQQLKSLLHERK